MRIFLHILCNVHTCILNTKTYFTFSSSTFVDGQSSVKPYSYIPFGAGPRMCIGNKFAMMEMKVMLATLLKAYSFSEVPGCTVKAVPRLTTQPEGLKLFIRPAGLKNSYLKSLLTPDISTIALYQICTHIHASNRAVCPNRMSFYK